MDFNIKKVRNLQRCMRFFEYGIITLVVLYTSILGHILFFGKDGFEGINVFLFGIFFLCFLYRDLSETEDSSSLLINLNRWLFFHGVHCREQTPTERNITKSFFEKNDFEVPFCFTVDEPDCYNAFAIRLRDKEIFLMTERVFRDCSITDIWAILAHEKGHFLNHDNLRIRVANILMFFAWWFSVFVLLKIIVCLLFLQSELLYPAVVYFVVSYFVLYFLISIKLKCDTALCLIHDILADVRAALILDSANSIKNCLQTLQNKNNFPGFEQRKKALLFILEEKPIDV